LRILLIAHTNLPWTPLYACWLQARGHTVRVLSFHPDRHERVDSVFLGVEPFDKYRNKHVYVTRLPRVRRELTAFRPDVVLASYVLSNGLMAAVVGGAPFVVDAVGGDVLVHPDHPRWRTRLQDALIRFVCGRASAVRTVAPHLTARLESLGVALEKLETFPIGVDLSRFRAAPAAPDRGARLVCTRSHMPVYDIPTLLRALVPLAGTDTFADCTFVGGGDLLEDHRSLAASLGLGDRTRFLGPVDQDRVAEALRDADVYVSAAVSDGASSSLLEAMATGLVPVVTRHPANLDWVEEGANGLLFAAGDADDLAAALERACTDAALRGRARRENPGRVARDADLEQGMARLEALLERVSEGRGDQFGT
jgi:glycosyltransferase involved in cell wall biosynthesis